MSAQEPAVPQGWGLEKWGLLTHLQMWEGRSKAACLFHEALMFGCGSWHGGFSPPQVDTLALVLAFLRLNRSQRCPALIHTAQAHDEFLYAAYPLEQGAIKLD